MNADFKSNILSLVTIEEFLRRYGFEKNRAGFINCPFHTEKTASCRIYPDTNTFYCFGCGKGGNVIDFAMSLFSIPFKTAIEQINNDFCLNLPIGRKMSIREKYQFDKQSKQLQAERKKQEEERNKVYDTYYEAMDKVIALKKQISELAPNNMDEPLNPDFVSALHALPLAEYEEWLAEGEVILFANRRNHDSEFIAGNVFKQKPA